QGDGRARRVHPLPQRTLHGHHPGRGGHHREPCACPGLPIRPACPHDLQDVRLENAVESSVRGTLHLPPCGQGVVRGCHGSRHGRRGDTQGDPPTAALPARGPRDRHRDGQRHHHHLHRRHHPEW